MPLSKEEVQHVAELARLHLNEAELEKFTQQLSQILDYAEQLNALDTTGVVPTSHAIPMKNVFREDEVRDSMEPEKALENAPDGHEQSFRVPRIVE